MKRFIGNGKTAQNEWKAANTQTQHHKGKCGISPNDVEVKAQKQYVKAK